jgi:hypothetical protein
MVIFEAPVRTARWPGRPHLPGTEVFTASFGGQLFRYPRTVEILSSRLLRVSSDLSRRFEVGGTLVATARRFVQGKGSE